MSLKTNENEVANEKNLPAPKIEVSTSMKMNVNDAIRKLEDEEGMTLDLGFNSFPTVVIDNGRFKTNAHDNLGEEMTFLFAQKRPQWCYSAEPVDRDSKEEPEVYYSDDEVTLIGNESEDAEAFKARIDAKEGWTFQKTKYAVVLCEVKSGELKDEVAFLHVSQTSIAALDGQLAIATAKGLDIKKTLWKAAVGPEAKKGRFTWNPWKFSVEVPVEA